MTASSVSDEVEASGGGDLRGRCLTALESARDPELGVSLVGLGLVQDVHVEGACAQVKLTFTSMGCPWMDWIQDSVRDALLRVPEIASVAIEVVWDRPWTPQSLRGDARRTLQDLGISTT